MIEKNASDVHLSILPDKKNSTEHFIRLAIDFHTVTLDWILLWTIQLIVQDCIMIGQSSPIIVPCKSHGRELA